MSIKITEQNKSVLVRRWKYNPERKRSLPTTIMSIAKWKMPGTFTEEQIKEFELTQDEIGTYEKYVLDSNEESEKITKRVNARHSIDKIKDLMIALSDTEAQQTLSDEDIETLSENTNELKKLVTSIKAKRKRKAKKPTPITVNIS